MFYTYRQNNSGGSFDYSEDRGISVVVVVEADSAAEADARAESIGLYFDGAGDCSCCGDRWSSQDYGWSGGKGTPVPTQYGEPIDLDAPMPDSYHFKWMDGYEGFVHYADGTVRGFWA